jgi:uncharacterized damage-inducible protein DinB
MQTTYSIDEDITVEINLEEVIFNLVNHSSYHRGQIISLLRLHNVKVPVTDYYWFKRAKIQKPSF